MEIYIVGAHSRSQTLGFYLQTLNPDIQIKAYLITNDEHNPPEVSGVPVRHINNKTNDLDTSLPVYVGTRGVFYEEIGSILERIGFANIIYNTPDLDIKLRNQFLRGYYANKGYEFEKLTGAIVDNSDAIDGPKTKVYVIKSIYDNPTKEVFDNREFEYELQVGASLTTDVICDYTDNVGDNISEKNKTYCELTGLYWMWRNSTEDIIGLEHYRRRFLLPENWAQELYKKNIDVILPTPLYTGPSLKDNYGMRHTASDLCVVMDIIKEKYPEYYDAAVSFFEDSVYSPCNMFIMKRKVLDKYCSWLFPILFEAEKRIETHIDAYQNRYTGFLAERLMSFYFDYHRNEYHTVFCDKNFIG